MNLPSAFSLPTTLLVALLLAAALAAPLTGSAPPTEWWVNCNGYTGTLEYSVGRDGSVKGTLLGRPVQGRLEGRRLILDETSGRRSWQGWVLDRSLGAPGEADYDGAWVLSGTFTGVTGREREAFPWYGVDLAMSPDVTGGMKSGAGGDREPPGGYQEPPRERREPAGGPTGVRVYEAWNRNSRGRRYGHIFRLDPGNCKFVSDENSTGEWSIVKAEMLDCRPDRSMSLRLTSKNGYWIHYEWSFRGGGATFEGTWKGSKGESGHSAGTLRRN